MFAKSHHRSFPPSLRHKGQSFWSPSSAWLETLLCLLHSARCCDLYALARVRKARVATGTAT